jgi:hypothetical protein
VGGQRQLHRAAAAADARARHPDDGARWWSARVADPAGRRSPGWIAPFAPSRSWPRRARSRAARRRAGWSRRSPREERARGKRGRRRTRPRRRRRRRPTAASRSSARRGAAARVRARRRWTRPARAALPRELRAAVDEPRVRVGAQLCGLLREGGCAGGRSRRASRWRRWGRSSRRCCSARCSNARGAGLFGVVVALLAALLASSCRWRGRCAARGRAIEEKFRDLFMRKIPAPRRSLLPEPARVRHGRARAPGAQAARAAERWPATSLRTALEIVVIAGALVWLDPRGAVLAIGLAAAMLIIPLAAQPAVAERDLRMRKPRRQSRAFLSRRAAGTRDDPDARRGAGARARAAPRPPARMGALRRARPCARR